MVKTASVWLRAMLVAVVLLLTVTPAYADESAEETTRQTEEGSEGVSEEPGSDNWVEYPYVYESGDDEVTIEIYGEIHVVDDLGTVYSSTTTVELRPGANVFNAVAPEGEELSPDIQTEWTFYGEEVESTPTPTSSPSPDYEQNVVVTEVDEVEVTCGPYLVGATFQNNTNHPMKFAYHFGDSVVASGTIPARTEESRSWGSIPVLARDGIEREYFLELDYTWDYEGEPRTGTRQDYIGSHGPCYAEGETELHRLEGNWVSYTTSGGVGVRDDAGNVYSGYGTLELHADPRVNTFTLVSLDDAVLDPNGVPPQYALTWSFEYDPNYIPEEPTQTPSPSATTPPSVTPTSTPTQEPPTAQPTGTPGPTQTPTSTVSPPATTSPSGSPSASASISPSDVPTATPTQAPTGTPAPTQVPTPTPTTTTPATTTPTTATTASATPSASSSSSASLPPSATATSAPAESTTEPTDAPPKPPTSVEPAEPSRDGNALTIPDHQGTVYKDQEGKVLPAGRYDLTESVVITAYARDGYVFPPGITRHWAYQVHLTSGDESSRGSLARTGAASSPGLLVMAALAVASGLALLIRRRQK